MLNIFKLTNAMNEAAYGYSMPAVEAYKFIGTMDEATTEFNYQVMKEAVSMREFDVNTDEIMVEAILTDSSRMGALSENIIESIRTNLNRFWEKIKGMVKGIIEKLKAWFYQLTGKNDKWVKLMKPRIEKAKNQPGHSDYTAEMHKWNIDYVTSGMLSGIDAVLGDSDVGLDMSAIDKGIETVKAITAVEGKISVKISTDEKDDKGEPKYNNYDFKQGDNADSDEIKRLVEGIEQATENMKTFQEEFKEGYVQQIASKLQLTDVKDMDDLMKEIAEKATGGEKVSVKLSEVGTDKMLTAIEKSKKTAEGLRKSYDKHLTNLDKAHKKIDSKMASIKMKNPEKYPQNAVSALTAYVKTLASAMSSTISTLETLVNNVRGANVKYVNDMTSEYIRVLSKFAGFKGTKD